MGVDKTGSNSLPAQVEIAPSLRGKILFTLPLRQQRLNFPSLDKQHAIIKVAADGRAISSALSAMPAISKCAMNGVWYSIHQDNLLCSSTGRVLAKRDLPDGRYRSAAPRAKGGGYLFTQAERREACAMRRGTDRRGDPAIGRAPFQEDPDKPAKVRHFSAGPGNEVQSPDHRHGWDQRRNGRLKPFAVPVLTLRRHQTSRRTDTCRA